MLGGPSDPAVAEGEGTASMALRGKQTRYLRSLGHHLRPAVTVGKEGVTDALVRGLGEALETHELVKVKLTDSAGRERRSLGAQLAERAEAELVQVLGRTLLLYRARGQDPRIHLPD